MGTLGRYERPERVVVIDTRLDAYSDWERAAVLAHELQHAADHARGLPDLTTRDCYARAEDAFRREAEVWSALWRGRLPEPQNGAHTLLNQIASTVQQDPVRFGQQLLSLYRHECG